MRDQSQIMARLQKAREEQQYWQERLTESSEEIDRGIIRVLIASSEVRLEILKWVLDTQDKEGEA